MSKSLSLSLFILVVVVSLVFSEVCVVSILLLEESFGTSSVFDSGNEVSLGICFINHWTSTVLSEPINVSNPLGAITFPILV